MSLLSKINRFVQKIKPVNPADFGILGMNARNIDYVLEHNPRQYFPMVDNKLLTKKMAQEAGIPVPELYETVEFIHDIKPIIAKLDQYQDGFVIKPVAGAGGGGIIVITEVKNGLFFNSSGLSLTKRELGYHMVNILAGLYSLGGRPDTVMIEKRIIPHDVFNKIAFKGVPDVRVIVFKGYPIMAMLRLPTRKSDGKANLHVGGIGVGIGISTGETNFGIANGKYIDRHTDTHEKLSELIIPHWDQTLEIAAKIADFIPLGYLGCDFIYDAQTGVNLLEVNARPGLAVQIANRTGLKPRLEKVTQHIKEKSAETFQDRIAFCKKSF